MENKVVMEDLLLKISFAGKLNGDLVDIHTDQRFDLQHYRSGLPLINSKKIIVNNQSIKLFLVAYPPNL